MAKNTLHSNFTTGELAPRIKSRIDLGKFQAALEYTRNFIITPAGAAVRRPGTKYIIEANDQTNPCRLMPFQFSIEQAYALEWSDNALRILRNKGIVATEDTDASITNGTFDSDISGWTVNSATWNSSKQAVNITGTGGYIRQEINITTDNTARHTIGFDVIGDPGTQVSFLVGTTAGGSDIVSSTVFKAGYHVFSFVPNNDTFFIQFSKTTSGTIILDNIKFFTNGAPLTLGSPYTFEQIGSIDYAQSADVMYLAQGQTDPYKLKRLGADIWSLEAVAFTASPFTTATKKPRVVTFYEQRLWFGNTDDNPQTLYASKSADFENFTTGTNDDDALVYTIASDQINPIQWLSPGKVLAIGTAGGEFTMRASSLDEAITPTNVKAVRETTNGCAPIKPIKTGSTTLFVQRLGHKLREFVYSFDIDSYRADDLLLLAEHLGKEVTIDELAHMREPWNIVWARRSDGLLLSMTYEREQQVVAWTRCPIGGTDAKVEALCCIPDENQDALYLSVSRTINGSTVRYIEVLQDEFSILDTASTSDAWFVDCALDYEGTETTTLSGLDHLENEEVQILRNGAVAPNKTVSSGSVSILPATKAVAGLFYDSYIQDFSVELQAQSDSSKGLLTSIFEAVVHLHNSLGMEYGTALDNLSVKTFRTGQDKMNQAPPLFTGELAISLTGWSRDQTLFIRQSQPLPLTILGIAYKVAFGQR